MKRDMDLVRYILMEVEGAEDNVHVRDLVTESWSFELICYHLEMLVAHGLVDGHVFRNGVGHASDGVARALTWDGCDYLDAIRSDTVWAKTKRVIKEAAVSVTLSVIKDAASLVAMQAIKGQLGIA